MDEKLEFLRADIRKFVETEIEPLSNEIEETDSIPASLARKIAEKGLHGLAVPREYGGSGFGALEMCVAFEELAGANQSVIRFIGGSVSGLAQFGSEAIKTKYFPRIARGESRADFALSEPDAGTDAASIRTHAERRGDYYYLNGTKHMISNGSVNDLHLVFAVTDTVKRAHGGVSAFVVEKDFPGFSVDAVQPKMGLRGMPTARLRFDNCRVPVENLVGDEGEGFVIAMAGLDSGRLQFIGAVAVGASQKLLELSVEYARTRKQFGQTIGRFQAIQWMLADMATDIHAARLMVHEAARKLDRGEIITLESSMVKLFTSEMACRVADRALQIHGASGLLKGSQTERFYRDARLGRIWDGTS
ncbi:MAG: acyl-CoA dehydrogenase family protein [Candidatus Lindowbacteria bacterium]|nr:acyl-CoA dehydrogenase family protein [Candidatus Lindowbacteria bacterium]